MPLVLDADMRLDNTLDGEYGTLQYFSDYHSYTGPMTITPTDEDQVLETEGLLMLDNLTVEAIPGDAVGSDIPRQDSSSLEVVGPRVTAPAGYYAADAGATVQSGTAGTPTITETGSGEHTIVLTPSVYNETGWITGGTKVGTGITIAAEDLVSGTYTVEEAGTHDVTIYENISVGSGTAGTPTITKSGSGEHTVTLTPSVTNATGWITGGTKVGTGITIAAEDLVSGTYTVDSSGTADVTDYASISVPSGTVGTPVATKGTVSNHSVTVTPSVTNQTGWITGSTETGTAVTVSASELVSGSQTVTENDTYNVTNLAELVVNVAGHGTLQTRSVSYTPTTSQQTDTILPEDGYDGMDEVDVTIAAVPTGSVTIGNRSATSGATIEVNSSTGALSAEASVTVPIVPSVTAGYVSSVESGSVTVTVTGSGQLSTQAADTITPTESQQTAVAAGKYTLGAVTVDAIPSTYVGSGIDQLDDSDLWGAYDDGVYSVGTPAGYYEYPAYKNVPSGTEGTPTATKGSVTNHSVTVTPSVTNVGGYIEGGTHNGTAVTVTAKELVSGTLAITSEALDIDVANYDAVDVTLPTAGILPDAGYSFVTEDNTRKFVVSPTAYVTSYGSAEAGTLTSGTDIKFNAIPSGTSVSPTESAQTIGGTRYMLEGAVTVNAIPSNYVGSGVTQRSSSDLSISGNVVTAPAGYYPNAATYTLTNGNNISYGITDGTLPLAGVAKAGYAEI